MIGCLSDRACKAQCFSPAGKRVVENRTASVDFSLVTALLWASAVVKPKCEQHGPEADPTLVAGKAERDHRQFGSSIES